MAHYDNVLIVAQRVTTDLTHEILESTRSALKGLESRCPPGTFGSKDNGIRRAAALLEYVAREHGGHKLSMAELAKAASLRERDFIKFHQQVGNFRQAKTITTKPQSMQSSFPSLAMKLGSHVTDSSGVALRAQKLLLDIALFCRKNKQQLQDMVRLQKTYEAASFYIIATQDTKDESEEKHLRASTVVDVSNDFTLSDFASVEQHIRDLMDDMKQSGFTRETETERSPTERSRKKRKESSSSARTSKDSSGDANRTTKRSKQAAESMINRVRERAEDIEQSFTENDIFQAGKSPSLVNQLSVFSTQTKFMKWREQVLSQAIETAKKEMLTSKDNDDNTNGINREQALESAASLILKSYGLLQT